MTQDLRAFYSRAPIKDLDTLAEVLDTSVVGLRDLVSKADASYRMVPQKKKDGTPRLTWDACPQLKAVHQRIKNRILVHAKYPFYLQGGIRDIENPRDYARNANIHAGQACVINEDIAEFYPSITTEHIYGIWRTFFRFDDEVSRTLTLLTTRAGVVPQGARTSSYLANLVFWNTEPDLVRYLASRGLRYSRFADDVTVSSARPLTRQKKSEAIALVYAFIKRSCFRPKYSKHRLYNGNERMLVNNLVVNSTPALPEEERKRIRLVTFIWCKSGMPQEVLTLRPTFAHVQGKIAKFSRFHPREGKQLLMTFKARVRSRSKSI